MIRRTLSTALLSALACLAQEQTATVTGTVTDFLGSPVGHQILQLESEEANGLRFSAEANNLGQFRFVDIPAGTYRLELHGPGLQTLRKTGIRLAPGQQMSVPPVVPILDRCGEPSVDWIERLSPADDSAALRGSLLDSSGSPIVGATISLNCAGCVTKTNPAGQFVFSDLKPGNYTIAISTTGFYREFLPTHLVFKNQDWTFSPIELERCPSKGCERIPRQEKILPQCY